MVDTIKIGQKKVCYHCGEDCANDHIHIQEKNFCCEGCKMVYEIINQNGLCTYYDIEKNPGIAQKVKIREGKFAFLDDKAVEAKLVHFSDEKQKHVIFYLPQMHCSSCIWLLEHLNKLNAGIVKSQVNFLKKEVSIVYNISTVSLRKVAELLTTIGYEPHISLHDISNKKIRKYDKKRVYKIGIAGFCFANIMMFSFPEYFGLNSLQEKGLREYFSYLNMFLALPVFFYCASDFFVSSWKSLQQRFLNIDAPIALAIVITFGRSIYEILSHTGAGYLDSMSGIVFFMLLGRFFQNKTYQTLSFDRDYTSYFPLGVTTLNEDGTENQIPISNLKNGQRIKIHSGEIIPADAILFLGKAHIDYSFVTGESIPIEKSIGEIIYAGGKQTAGAIELEVVKEVSQSYLTQLWDNDAFKENADEKSVSFIHQVSRYFTYALFSVAIISAIYWQINNPAKTWNAVTSILIVACPCALLLSATFTNGNMLRMLQKFGFYAKNANVIERVASAKTLVFDKTGTITHQKEADISYNGALLSKEEEQLIRSLATQSSHPLSKAIASYVPFSKAMPVKHYHETKGLGSTGIINSLLVKLGSAQYITGKKNNLASDGSRVYVAINEDILGYFLIKTTYRTGLEKVIRQLQSQFKLALISGDNDAERQTLIKYFDNKTDLRFEQKPQDKLNYIKALQQKGEKVIMLGDGLNDAGALKQSDIGIVITDDINNFSPASDAILDGKSFTKFSAILSYCKNQKTIIFGSFIISILYNFVGLYFAVQGSLQPVIAAILMPISSISIVLFTTGMSSLFARKLRD
ncbi:MAG TPA: heavy metal translocating P-type ATPase metal-binding domain-containing protein [Bacteroidia bacterium]|nr:heavy metal translocating P-type ATPase metal-binding domain-containing protein [Bacteroidia bacterium]